MPDSTTHIKLHYEYLKCAKPEAETVLLVHGVGLDLSIWDDVLPLFQKDFHVLRCDMPGHGKSESAKGLDSSWELLINSIKALMNRLALSSVHFIGHGGGGVLGLEIVKKENGLLRTLTLAATPIYIPKEFTQQELNNRIEVVSDSSRFEQLTARLANTVSHQPPERSLAKLTAIYKSVCPYDYIGYFKLVTETILDYRMEEIRQLDIPMMMLQGEYDPLFPLEMQVMNIPYLKNMRFFIIPESGHVLMMDQPVVFSQFLKMFIKKQTGTGGTAFTYTDALKKEVNSIVRSGLKTEDSQHKLEINVINRFSIKMNGKEIEGKWNQRKAKELIAYLAYHRSVTREQLYDLYWPEHQLDKARNLLRVSLNHIKSMFENHTGESIENYLEINRDSINLKVPCKLDLQELYSCLDEIEQTSDYELKAKWAIEKFSGLPDPLFPLFYDDWFLKIRTTLESRIIRICEELLDAPPKRETAVELLRILVKLDPGEEFYQEQLISLLHHTNRHKEARYFRNKSDSSFL